MKKKTIKDLKKGQVVTVKKMNAIKGGTGDPYKHGEVVVEPPHRNG